jgi:hypothetical protein
MITHHQAPEPPPCFGQLSTKPGTSSILSLTLFEKTPIFQALSDSNLQEPEVTFPNQLSLFDL